MAKSPRGKRDARDQVRILKDHVYAHAPAVRQSFREGQTPHVPPSVAKALIKAGVAEPITADKEA